MPASRLIILLTLFCTGLLASQNALAFRCKGGLITEGDSKITVLKKCGEPSWKDRWSEETIEYPYTDIEHRNLQINERWIYNPGPTQFIRIINFKGSKVFSIETGSRGFTVVPGLQRCDFDTFSMGTTSAEVAAKCGEPDMTEQRLESVTRPIAGGRQQVSVTVEEWTFNLGPTRFMRILVFHNGDLVEVRTGEKGF